MQDGKYDLAREAYSASLAAKPTHLAFANRAMALLKLRDFRAAEADCTSAIELEPSYVKVRKFDVPGRSWISPTCTLMACGSS